METFRDLSVVEELRKELTERHSFQDIISKNKEMRSLFGILEQVSESDATILLEGESGTGKELFAKAIHALSPRKTGPSDHDQLRVPAGHAFGIRALRL